MTLTLEKTKHKPIIGIKSAFEEKILIAPINPPKDSEPVSPIKTLALGTLKIRKPKIAPIKQAHKITRFSYSAFLR